MPNYYVDTDGEFWTTHPTDAERVVLLEAKYQADDGWDMEQAVELFGLQEVAAEAGEEEHFVYLVEMNEGLTERYSTEDAEIELNSFFLEVDYPDGASVSIPVSSIRKVTRLPLEA